MKVSCESSLYFFRNATVKEKAMRKIFSLKLNLNAMNLQNFGPAIFSRKEKIGT